MKAIIAAVALAAAAFTFAPKAASAMPVAPVDEAVTTHIEKTYGGCGWNGHRGPYGGCRFGGQRQVTATVADIMAAPIIAAGDRAPI